MRWHRSPILVLFFSSLALCILPWLPVSSAKSYRKRKHDSPASRNAKFLNRSGAKVDFAWIHVETGKVTDSHTQGEGIVWGGETGINTFVGHQFEVVELSVGHNGSRCLHKECRRTRFQINENEDQVFTLDENFEISVEDNKSRAMDKARKALASCERDTSLSTEEQIAQLAACMEKQVQSTLNQTKDEIEFQASLRKDMGKSLVQYTCDDPKAPTTESYRNESWTFTNPTTRQREKHEVQVLFETELTAVKYVPNMFTVEQCEALLGQTVVNEKGQLVLPSDSKKDMSIVQILMKIQNLYKSFLGLSIAFSSDPLVVLESFKAEPQLADGECAVCDEDKNGGSKECAQRPDNAASPGVHRKMLESEEDPVSTSLLVVCSTGQGSAFHFPRTGTHVALKQPGDGILVVHRDKYGESENELFLQDFAICKPWMGELTYVLQQKQFLEEE
mmetsp:Transcript_14836/g.28105  ORF Transcript_14836/g.28105 Transcript_14836/m.28105 type:complete len:448 (+) Transcript_14836:212-1555(+)